MLARCPGLFTRLARSPLTRHRWFFAQPLRGGRHRGVRRVAAQLAAELSYLFGQRLDLRAQLGDLCPSSSQLGVLALSDLTQLGVSGRAARRCLPPAPGPRASSCHTDNSHTSPNQTEPLATTPASTADQPPHVNSYVLTTKAVLGTQEALNGP
jgi:hypothetical protein